MVANKMNAALFGVGEEKEVALIKRVKLTQKSKFRKMLEVAFY